MQCHATLPSPVTYWPEGHCSGHGFHELEGNEGSPAVRAWGSFVGCEPFTALSHPPNTKGPQPTVSMSQCGLSQGGMV